MHLPSRFKLMTVFSLLVIFAVSLILLGSTRLVTHGASASLKPSLKSGGTSAPSGVSCGIWNVVPNPILGSGSILNGVAAISANNVWTVGGSLIEHWNGIRWSVIPGPKPEPYESDLFGVVAISTNNVWAVGNYFIASSDIAQTLIEHWNGTRWSVVSSPNLGSYENYLTGIAAVSASNIWAVGHYDSSSSIGYQTLIEHWDGKRWSVVPSPNVGASENYLNGITALSANNVWAVGDYKKDINPQQTLIEHWDGTSWSLVSSPNLGLGGNGLLNGVVPVPGTNQVWSVGVYSNSSDTSPQTLIEHWDGSHWSVVSSPNPGSFENFLFGIAVVSVSNVWVVGQYSNNSGPVQTLIEHWDGTSWSVASSPNPGPSINSLNGVVQVPGTSYIWAVGYNDRPGSSEQALTEFYC